MISLAMIKSNSSSGPIKKMMHIPTMQIFCVKEVPISSREDRATLKNCVAEWEEATAEGPNDHLVSIEGTHWNTPEGCVSIVFEHLNGGSLHVSFHLRTCYNQWALFPRPS